jgi:hypothetical protein
MKTKAVCEQTLCWRCKNTYADKCCWFKDFTPVPGWDAVPTKLSAVSEARVPRYVDSYLVRRCPNFEPLEGFEPIEGPSANFDKNMKGSNDMKGVNAEKQALIEKREELYKAGATDAEIAGIQHVGVETVRVWRVKRGYPKNPDAALSGPDDPEEKQETAAESATEAEKCVACGQCLDQEAAYCVRDEQMQAPVADAATQCAWEKEKDEVRQAQLTANHAAAEVNKIFNEQMEKLEECRASGMIVSDKPWDGEEPDPYAYDGSMTPEDFERRSELLLAEREAEGRNKMTAATLMQILARVPAGAVVTCAECGEGFEWAILRQEYDIHGNPGVAEIVLGGER